MSDNSKLTRMIRRLDGLLGTQDQSAHDFTPPSALREVPSISSDHTSSQGVGGHAELVGDSERDNRGAFES